MSTSTDDFQVEVPYTGSVVDDTKANVFPKNKKKMEHLENVHIVAVIYLENRKKCLKCASKMLIQEASDPEVVKCSKCSILPLYSACDSSISSKITTKSPQTAIPITLLVFGDLIEEITEHPTDGLTLTSLLKAPPQFLTRLNCLFC